MARFSSIIFLPLILVLTTPNNIFSADNAHEDMVYKLEAFKLGKNGKGPGTRIHSEKRPVLADREHKEERLFCMIKEEQFCSSHDKGTILNELPRENIQEGINEENITKYKIVISYKTGREENNTWTNYTILPENKVFEIKSLFSNGQSLQNVYYEKFTCNRPGIYPLVFVSHHSVGSGNNVMPNLTDDQIIRVLWDNIVSFQNFIRLLGFVGLIAGCSHELTKRWYNINKKTPPH